MNNKFDFIIEKSKDNYDVIKVNTNGKWHYLGSKYNQEREIKKFMDMFKTTSDKDNYIIFGLSCGEHIEKLLQNCHDDSHILIIEPNLKLIDYLSTKHKIDYILNNEKVTIYKSEKDIYSFFNKYINSTNVDFVRFGIYSNYIDVFNELIYLYKLIKEQMQANILRRNTSLEFSDMWFFDLFLDNLPYISESEPLNSLQNKYKDIPAVIVSAGPSLEKNIKDLKKINKNAMIISGGRTLKPLLQYEIEPDCLVVVDPGKVSYQLVEQYIEKCKCPLLFYEGTNNDVVKNHNDLKIIASHNKFIHNIFNKELAMINYGGSVAHAMTFFAAYLGCSPIIFIGQDLAYTDNKLHADCARDSSSTDSHLDELYVKSQDGSLIKTDAALNTFRLELEEIIKFFADIEFIDATEGGAYIKGTKVKTLKEVIKDLDDKKIISINKLINPTSKKENCISSLRDSIKIMKKCCGICRNGKLILKEFKNAYFLHEFKKLKYLNKKLNVIDKELKKTINDLDILCNLIFNVIYNINCNNKFVLFSDDKDDEKIKKQLDKNLAIYDSVDKIIRLAMEKVENKISFILES